MCMSSPSGTFGAASLTRARRSGQRQWQRLARQLGASHVDAIEGKAHAILHPGDDDTLELAERGRAPVRAMRAAVVPRGRQTANVALAAIIVGRYSRVAQEGK